MEVQDLELVTVTGTVRTLRETLVAPLSGMECVAHRSCAKVFAKHGRRRRLVGVHARSQLVRFALVTRNGDIVVDGADADLAIRPRSIIPRRVELEQAFMADSAISYVDSLSCDEIVICSGQKIRVHGIARVEVISGEALFRETPRVVRITGDDRHRLVIRNG